VQFLLSIFGDIHARDTAGRTIFDHVDNAQTEDNGSYQRDLWYCALERAGIDVGPHLVHRPRVPSYRLDGLDDYTPEHYHALKHLQSWDVDNFRSQMDRLLQEIPLDEDEALEMERLRRENPHLVRWQLGMADTSDDDESGTDDGFASDEESEDHDEDEGGGEGCTR
jgi:hypothetical protein